MRVFPDLRHSEAYDGTQALQHRPLGPGSSAGPGIARRLPDARRRLAALVRPGRADGRRCRRDARGAASPAPQDAVTRLAEEVRGQGWIVYGARSAQGDWDLFVCRPDGSAVRPLTRTPEFSEFSPQFSRDGRRLLYRRVTRDEKLDNNRHGEQGELVVANARRLDPARAGRRGRVALGELESGRQADRQPVDQRDCLLSTSTRQVVRKLERKGFFQQVTWSPDGQWLVGVANSYGTGWSVARMNVATGEAGAVNRVDCCTPDWFPDSRNVIFSWRPPGQKANNGYGWTQLWRAAAEGNPAGWSMAKTAGTSMAGASRRTAKYVLFTGNVEEDGDPGPRRRADGADAAERCADHRRRKRRTARAAPGGEGWSGADAARRMGAVLDWTLRFSR